MLDFIFFFFVLPFAIHLHVDTWFVRGGKEDRGQQWESALFFSMWISVSELTLLDSAAEALPDEPFLWP